MVINLEETKFETWLLWNQKSIVDWYIYVFFGFKII